MICSQRPSPVSSARLNGSISSSITPVDSKVMMKACPSAVPRDVNSGNPEPARSPSSQVKKSKKSKKDPPPALMTKDGRIIEKPKRLRTAYNLFFQHHRELLLRSLPSRDSDKKPRNSHGKIDFTKLARTIAARWKAITDEEKAYFQELSAKDRARCEREIGEWKELERAQRSEGHSLSVRSEIERMVPHEENSPFQELSSFQPCTHSERATEGEWADFQQTTYPAFAKTQYLSNTRRMCVDLEPLPLNESDFMHHRQHHHRQHQHHQHHQQYTPEPMLSPFHEATSLSPEPAGMQGLQASSLEPIPYDPRNRPVTNLTETHDLANRLGEDCVAAMIRYFV